jgi:NCS1 family nucleobase:cation symporter-1
VFGCLTASATQAYFGEAIWNPRKPLFPTTYPVSVYSADISFLAVLSQLWLDTSYSSGARAGAFFTGLGLLICQVAINTVDNAFSGESQLAFF